MALFDYFCQLGLWNTRTSVINHCYRSPKLFLLSPPHNPVCTHVKDPWNMIPSLVLGTHGAGQQVHLPTMKEQTSIRGVCSIGAISTQRETDPGTEKRKCVGKFGKSQHFVEELRSLSWKYDFDSNYSNSFFLMTLYFHNKVNWHPNRIGQNLANGDKTWHKHGWTVQFKGSVPNVPGFDEFFQ